MKNVGKEEEMMSVSQIHTGEPSSKSRSKLKTECDAQLTELRVEEYHEVRVGTNILWAFIPCFLNREPSHVTTLQKS